MKDGKENGSYYYGLWGFRLQGMEKKMVDISIFGGLQRRLLLDTFLHSYEALVCLTKSGGV